MSSSGGACCAPFAIIRQLRVKKYVFDFIVDFMSRTGYLGVFALMFAENIFPPLPSELIMPFAGFAAARGDLNIVLVVLTGTAGSILGTLPWYYAGAWLGRERLRCLAEKRGRWLAVSPEQLEKTSVWFDRHGRRAVFFGRLVPAVRSLISVPAGIMRMPVGPFVAYSAAGSLLWSSLLCGAGYLLQSNYTVVAKYLDPVSKGIAGLIVAAYVYQVLHYHHPKSSR